MERCEALIIGGGVTGAGVARDLAMRGVDVVLLEKGDFSTGATGRSHGMLHGGGRYAVKDPESARECASESRILKRIASYCIEDTGGLFVSLKGDDGGFVERFRRGCASCEVAAEEISPADAFRLEPGLSRDLQTCFRVEDGTVDPFFLTLGNIESARECGARVLNHSELVQIVIKEGAIDGIRYRDGASIVALKPEILVNAGGAWADRVASMAGLHIPLRMDKGSLIVMNGRMTNGLVNRLRMPSDGDIIVPSHSTTILGTTSIPVVSPDSTEVTRSEVDLLMDQGRQMLPDIEHGRAIRAYAGVRPLPASGGEGREISRGFKLIDHAENSVDGMISVIGGKLTTYRLMAEKASDLVMRKLGRRGNCKTMHEEIRVRAEVPRPENTLDFPLTRIERKHPDPSGIFECVRSMRGAEMACSCEQVLRGELLHFARHSDVRSIGDLMRRTRAGMGYCQSGSCIFSLLSVLLDYSDRAPRELLNDYLKERWRGVSPVLHLGQMRQEVLKLHLGRVYGLGGDGFEGI